MPRVRALELRTLGFVESLFSGEHLSVFHGRGMEFSHVRSYQVGDDPRAIDWKVSARRTTPYVRQFVEERDLLVVLVVDVSASSRLGPGARSPAEVANEIAGALALAATRNNDRVALLLASDRVEHFLPPGAGRKHTVRLLADLVSARPVGRGTDLTPALERIERALTARASVFIISDFIHETGSSAFRAALRRVSRRHDLVAIRLTNAASEALPDLGWIEATDPETGERMLVDSASRRARERYARSVSRRDGEVASLLRESGVEIVDLDTSDDPLPVLADFFRRRQRIPR